MFTLIPADAAFTHNAAEMREAEQAARDAFAAELKAQPDLGWMVAAWAGSATISDLERFVPRLGNRPKAQELGGALVAKLDAWTFARKEWRVTVRRVYLGTEGDDEDQAEVRVRIETWDGVRYGADVCPDLDPAYGWDAVVGERAAARLDTDQLQALLGLAREALAAKRAE